MKQHWRKLFLVINLSVVLFASLLQAKDPTRPGFMAKTEKPKSAKSVPTKQPLTAIFNKKNQPSAVIEGKLYYVGDFYQESKIQQITHDSVWLISAGESRKLSLLPNVKTASKK